MSNFFSDNEDLRYYLTTGVDWEAIYTLVETGPDNTYTDAREAIETWQEMLDLVGALTANEIAPYAEELDQQKAQLIAGEVTIPPRMKTIFEQFTELGLHGLCVPRAFGGMNAPLTVYLLMAEIVARGDVSVMTHLGFHGGIATAILLYSALEGSIEIDPQTLEVTDSRFRGAIEEIVAGKAWGAMDITEPDAGSDMAALRTTARQDADGNWTITGQKIFITSGHGKYHIVIARTEEEPGLDGLSLFLVPTYEDTPDGRVRHVTIGNLEDKLGHRASATVTLHFDGSPAELIGKRGEGFKLMLMLMNNARISVGFESIGLCEAAVRAARRYASERVSMGKTIDRHEIIADYLDEMETDIIGLRALAVRAAFHEEVTQRKRMVQRLSMEEGSDAWEEAERDIRQRTWSARRVTPLIKFMAAEKAVMIAQRAIQIHGGAGYMREYGVEKLLRDAMVLPIYEGTSQIQALMATKDNLLWAMKNPTDFVALALRTETRAHSGDPLYRKVARIRARAFAALRHLMTRIVKDKFGHREGSLKDAFREWEPKRDFAPALLHAEHLTWLLGDAAICEELMRQSKEHPHRRIHLSRYLERAEPRSRDMLFRIRNTGDRLLDDLFAASPHDSEPSTSGPTSSNEVHP